MLPLTADDRFRYSSQQTLQSNAHSYQDWLREEGPMKPGNHPPSSGNGANSGGFYREMRVGKDSAGLTGLYFPPSSARWMRAFSLVYEQNTHDKDKYARNDENRTTL
jgi:hypothetical protein